MDMTVQPHGELDVIGDGVGPRPSDLLEEVFLDQQEGSGNAKHALESAESDAGPLETPGILNLLIHPEQCFGKFVSGDPTLRNGQSIRRTDNAGNRSDPRIPEERACHVEQCIGIKDAIGINDTEEGIS